MARARTSVTCITTPARCTAVSFQTCMAHALLPFLGTSGALVVCRSRYAVDSRDSACTLSLCPFVCRGLPDLVVSADCRDAGLDTSCGSVEESQRRFLGGEGGAPRRDAYFMGGFPDGSTKYAACYGYVYYTSTEWARGHNLTQHQYWRHAEQHAIDHCRPCQQDSLTRDL